MIEIPSNMKITRSVLAIILAFASVPSIASDQAAALPAPVKRILAAYDMPAESFSVYIQPLGAGEPLLEFNAGVPRNPASTIKLLTTYLALEALGPAYQWQTRVFAGGEVRDGKLDGDLYIKGYGDPSMVLERVWLLIRRIRNAGIQEITGDLIIDDSYFTIPHHDPGEFDGQPYRTYNVAPNALLWNFNAISFQFQPDAADKMIMINADPDPVNLSIINNLRLTGGRCGGFQNGIDVAAAVAPQVSEVSFSGNFGRRCNGYRMTRSVMPPHQYAYGVFQRLWRETGGKFDGGLRRALVPDDLDAIVTMGSLSLGEVMRSVNKWSNNLMARHLLLTLGAERLGPPATLEKAHEAVEQVLAELGLELPNLNLDNGSGLSRDVRISARELGELLVEAHQSIYRAEFVSSMALAGLDGTMRRRFRNDPMTGRLHIKTGRLDNVFAMAGYLRSAAGQDYVVVALHNYPRAHQGPGEEAQTALLRWLYQQ